MRPLVWSQGSSQKLGVWCNFFISPRVDLFLCVKASLLKHTVALARSKYFYYYRTCKKYLGMLTDNIKNTEVISFVYYSNTISYLENPTIDKHFTT